MNCSIVPLPLYHRWLKAMRRLVRRPWRSCQTAFALQPRTSTISMRPHRSSVQQSWVNSTAMKTSSPTSLHRPVVSQRSRLPHTVALTLYFSDSLFFLTSPVAAVSIFPESGNFNVDNVRVCKILVSDIFCCWCFACTWSLVSVNLCCAYRVVGWLHRLCFMEWFSRRRQRETSHQLKMPKSLFSLAPSTAWWQRPR